MQLLQCRPMASHRRFHRCCQYLQGDSQRDSGNFAWAVVDIAVVEEEVVAVALYTVAEMAVEVVAAAERSVVETPVVDIAAVAADNSVAVDSLAAEEVEVDT